MLSYSLEIYRGDSYARRFLLWSDTASSVPVDLTGVTAAAQIRAAPDLPVMVTPVCVVTLPNIIDLHVAAADSALADSGRWDLQLTYSDGTIQTVLSGRVLVTADITQP